MWVAGVSAKGALLNRSLGHRPRYKVMKNRER